MRHQSDHKLVTRRRVTRYALLLVIAAGSMTPAGATTTTPSVTRTPTATATPDRDGATVTATPTHTAVDQLGSRHVVGRVYNDALGFAAGLAGATVTYLAPQGSGYSLTDANGDFAFDVALAESDVVVLRAELVRFVTEHIQTSGGALWDRGFIDLGLSPQPIEATPTPTYLPTPPSTGDLGVKHVTGHVHDGSQPVAGAAIDYVATHGSGTTVSDATGDFAFDLLLHDSDSVAIAVAAPGYVTAQLQFGGYALWTAPPLDVSLQLGGGVRISGQVSPDVGCATDAIVAVYLDSPLAGVPRRSTSPASDGAFSFDQVGDGNYTLGVETHCPLSDYPTQSVTVSGTVVEVDLTPSVCPMRLLLDPPHGPPGTNVDVRGRCYYVHSGQTARLFVDGHLQGQTTADTPGFYESSVQIPTDARPGAHRIHAESIGGTLIGESDFIVDGGQPPCPGDCNADGAVRIDELLMLVNIALGEALDTSCSAGIDASGTVEITTLVSAVDAALAGCAMP